ncbi:GLTSCR1 domain-containing protein [Meloidogyne graminicola]|uniref:GLTSCR1 domain-containing protein n=1 Tax=Meloidogyne graminicola TaxID=189291 RepID=A0A8S9ZCV2_9BILA|nr:GLTSCR1 domain-containing protein [Meloidogyne graminicola]
MLLSYTSSNIDNNRAMMDDFADQDWFAESDELTNVGIHKHSTTVDDQHQLHNVSQQSLQQHGHTNFDYLDLNVPVDENIFYSSNGEQSVKASSSQLHPQNFQHYLDVGVQNVNCGLPIQSNTSIAGHTTNENSHAFQVDQLPSQSKFRSDDAMARTSTPQTSISQVRQELNGIKCAYVDCMPSTSLAVLKPYTQEQPQMCRSQVQQLNLSQHQFYYDQRVLPSEHIQHHQQFNGQATFYGDPSAQELPQQNSTPLVRLDSPPIHLSVSSASSNAIHQQSQHLQQHYYLNQQPLQHNQPFNSQISVIDHQSSSFQLPLNYRPPSDQTINHHLQQSQGIVTTSNTFFPSNQLNQQQVNSVDGSAKSFTRKSAKTRRRPSVSSQSLNISNNGLEAKQQTSGLDQVAKSLFNNQKTTTLEFGDPQLAMEFASLIGRCQQLKEQEKSGIDVTSELKMVEERIAGCIMQNNTISSAKNTQNSPSLSNQIDKYSTSTESQITSKSDKNRLPRKRPNVPKKTSNSTIIQESKMVTNPHQNQQSKLQNDDQLQTTKSGTKIIDFTKAPVQFIEFNPTNSLPSTSYSSTTTTCLIDNRRLINSGKDDNSKEKHVSVLVPKSCSSSDNMVIYERRSMLVPAQDDQKLLAKQLEKQKEKRKENLTSYFEKMHEQLLNPNVNSPFESKIDCIERLLPYGLFSEPEFSKEFISQYDEELKSHKKLMKVRKQSIEHRLRSALIREALDDTHEQYNLLLYLDLEFGRRHHKSEISHLNSFKNEEISNKSPLSLAMDWEYNEWDDSNYQHILSTIEQKEEEIETELDITSNSANKIANCDLTIKEPRYASVSIRLMRKLPSIRNFKKFIIHTK